jgi:hypothetical protein
MPGRPRIRVGRVVCRWVGRAVLAVVLAGLLGWAVLAIAYADTHAGPRVVRASLFAVACAATVAFVRPRGYAVVACVGLFLVVLLWFFSLRPTNRRDWAPEVAREPWAQIDGDRVTLHNVRNFDYRAETDFTPAWEQREYDLSRVESVDLMLVYWGSPAIAHVMVSFGFDDGRYLCVSIETRKERGEAYSALQGFFRQYELVYVIGDERDVVRLRTNYRQGEDVYLYQTSMSPRQARDALVSYLEAANHLKAHPAFYNALTSNCASNVLQHARRGGLQGELTMDVVLSGHADRQAYRNGHLDRRLPFEQLRAKSRVNDAARAADAAPDFSRRIRADLPKPATRPASSLSPR